MRDHQRNQQEPGQAGARPADPAPGDSYSLAGAFTFGPGDIGLRSDLSSGMCDEAILWCCAAGDVGGVLPGL